MAVRQRCGTVGLLALTLLTVGCAPPASDNHVEDTAADESRWMEGRVLVSGVDPSSMTVLQSDGEPAVALVGAMEPELRRLQGATLRVGGTPERGSVAPGGALDVSSYEVLEIDGMAPRVGILVREGARYRLQGGDTTMLVGVPDALARSEGAKVWIIGRAGEDGLTVQSYGVIRP